MSPLCESLERRFQFASITYNPGMELDQNFDSYPDDWSKDLAVRAWDTTLGYGGSGKSLKLLTTTASGSYARQDLDLIAGQSYTMSARIKTSGVTGAGVQLRYVQEFPNSSVVNSTSLVTGTQDWTLVTKTFTAPANHVGGRLDILYTITAGNAWVDEVMVEPTSAIPTAAAPAISPNGGSFTGPQTVTMSTTTPNAEIRYTTDGTDPTRYSAIYKGAMRFDQVGAIKARTFHNAYTTSTATTATFTLAPKTTGGVPFAPVDRSRSIDEWWDGNIYNPGSTTYYGGTVQSPTTVVDVSYYKSLYPSSTSDGIEEALAAYPTGNITLNFPASGSPYVIDKPSTSTSNYYPFEGSIKILRQGNIHFISNSGATIRLKDGPAFGISSMQYADSGRVDTPVTNFYFKNITFDGNASAKTGVDMNHTSDVLFENVTFTNFADTSTGHPADVDANAKSDNIWFVNCTFQSGARGIYLDGVHGGGVINCTFQSGVKRAGILLLTNDDMATFSGDPRNSAYFVVTGSNFTFPSVAYTAFSINGADCLFTSNTVTGANLATQNVVFSDGKSSHTNPIGLTYQYVRNKVIGNTISNVPTLMKVKGRSINAAESWVAGDHLIKDNIVTGLNYVLELEADEASAPISDIDIESNYLSGSNKPQVWIKKLGVSNIASTGNDYLGVDRAFLRDDTGVSSSSATFASYRLNPTTPATPRIEPNGGTFAGPVTVKLVTIWPGATTRYTTNGVDPTGTSTAYSTPFTLSSTTTLKAKAFVGATGGSVASAVFTIGSGGPPPKASFQFNENTGTTTADATSVYTGTLSSGGLWTTGHAGSGLDLDGVDDAVTLTTNFNYDYTTYTPGAFTITAWIKPDDLTGRRTIFSNSGGFALETQNGKLQMRMRSATPSLNWYTLSGGTLTGGWQHAAVVYSVGAPVKLYLDGALVATSTQNLTFDNSGSSTNVIGAHNGTYFFDGKIDDVRFFESALSGTDINAVMNS